MKNSTKIENSIKQVVERLRQQMASRPPLQVVPIEVLKPQPGPSEVATSTKDPEPQPGPSKAATLATNPEPQPGPSKPRPVIWTFDFPKGNNVDNNLSLRQRMAKFCAELQREAQREAQNSTPRGGKRKTKRKHLPRLNLVRVPDAQDQEQVQPHTISSVDLHTCTVKKVHLSANWPDQYQLKEEERPQCVVTADWPTGTAATLERDNNSGDTLITFRIPRAVKPQPDTMARAVIFKY